MLIRTRRSPESTELVVFDSPVLSVGTTRLSADLACLINMGQKKMEMTQFNSLSLPKVKYMATTFRS